MARQPEAITARRRELGELLDGFLVATGKTKADLGRATNYDRTSISHICTGRQFPEEKFWQAADRFLRADGELLASYRAVEAAQVEYESRARQDVLARARAGATASRDPSILRERSTASQVLPLLDMTVEDGGGADLSEPIDDGYIISLRRQMKRLLDLDVQFGGNEASVQAVRLFRATHRRIGKSSCPRRLKRDLYSTAGELAEIAGWLLYDADQQDAARRINLEALYYLRWAGDRSVELLTLQNMSMQAEYVNRPDEALHIADSVLAADRLSPRLESLFLARSAHALAQQGQRHDAIRTFEKAKSLHLDGTRDSDPNWAYWVDDRQFAWFEARINTELGDHQKAADIFSDALSTSPRHRVRGLYSRTGYLFDSLVSSGDWRQAEELVSRLAQYVLEVGSGRTESILRATLKQVNRLDTPSNLRDGAAYLRSLLDRR